MATVYRALQPSLNRHVAIKVLPPYFQHDKEFVDRFKQEALAIAKLRHSNIIQIYTFFQENDLLCLVMEYVEGGSLYQLMQNGPPVTAETAIRITKEVASALDHAHSRGFIHRDIKPGNILLSGEQTAIVTDFGVAKVLDGSQYTKTSAFGIGTAQYMSPEQINGPEVGPASDLYSLGILLYEMITGKVPFDGDSTLSVAYSQIHEEPVSPRELAPETPKDIERLILQMLDKKPDARPAAGQIIKTLEKIERALKRKQGKTPQVPAQDAAVGRDLLVPPIIEAEPATQIGRPEVEQPTKVGAPEEPATTAGAVARAATETPTKVAPAISPEPKTTIKLETSVAETPTKVAPTVAAEPKTTIKLETSAPELSKAEVDSGAMTSLKVPKVPELPEEPRTEIRLPVVGQPAAREAETKHRQTDKPMSEQPIKPRPVPKARPDIRPLPAESPKRPKRLLVGLAAAVLAVFALVAGNFMRTQTADAKTLYTAPIGRSFLDLNQQIAVDRQIVLKKDGAGYKLVLEVALRNNGGSTANLALREVISKELAAGLNEIKFSRLPKVIAKKPLTLMFKLKLRSGEKALISGEKSLSREISEVTVDYVADSYKKALVTINGMAIALDAKEVVEGQEAKAVVSGLRSDKTTFRARGISLSSTNPKVATVDRSGRVRAVGFGQAEIVANAGPYEARAAITVLAKVVGLEISPASASVQPGQGVQLKALAVKSDGSKEQVDATWQASGAGRIDASGTFVGEKVGTAEITAIHDSFSGKATIQVSAPKPSTSGSRPRQGGTNPSPPSPPFVYTPPPPPPAKPTTPIPDD